MSNAFIQYPKGFLWGAATAAHQVEGNNHNNNWADWEKQPGKIKNGAVAGLACDWFGGQWKQDLDLAAAAGQNTHSFSIEWSRIQPTPDTWDEHAIAFYREMIAGMHQRGLMPMLTLHHFTDPLWLVEMGGWENDLAPEYFAKFSSRMADELKDLVQHWVTINEPNVYAYNGYLTGDFPPGKRDIGAAFKVMANLSRGHALAYHAIHTSHPHALVGLALHYRSFHPASNSPLDAWAAKNQSRLFNDTFAFAAVDGKLRLPFKTMNISHSAGTQDFIGLNYYTRDQVSFDITNPGQFFGRNYYRADAEKSETGFLANEPLGFREALKWAVAFNKPVYITENGFEDSTDTLRPKILAQHLHQLWHYVNFNPSIKGYYHWSLVDNFEWERGWTQRFGLWGLDTQTQKRSMRNSAKLYAEICKSNGIATSMIHAYCPEAEQLIFPD